MVQSGPPPPPSQLKVLQPEQPVGREGSERVLAFVVCETKRGGEGGAGGLIWRAA